ncbi:uncharacterized protein [Panulirus ornatus]|uniref:uncharacterized protein n=1 Tax=Panulirus ornatus TaxID=150431 RepID=UPI003A8BE0CE
MLSRVILVVALAAATTTTTTTAASVGDDTDAQRDSKLFPIVQVVTFDNAPCEASSGEHGTCYSQKECESLGGTASGTCANRFGVCCVLTVTCDGMLSVNNSYFVSPSYPSSYITPGVCHTELKPPAGTCQVLLEFEDFSLVGPLEGDCTNDTFVVLGANAGSSIPTLCGTNTGQHMYIDIDDSEGPFKLVHTLSSFSFPRHWKIKVSFIDKNNPCKAPNRCLQFFKETSGPLSSFNSLGSPPMMLNNQAYSICFAYVPGFCDIGFSFDKFDLGNTNQICGGDSVAYQGENLCGDFSPLTAQANATGPISLLVSSDDSNEQEQVGFRWHLHDDAMLVTPSIPNPTYHMHSSLYTCVCQDGNRHSFRRCSIHGCTLQRLLCSEHIIATSPTA